MAEKDRNSCHAVVADDADLALPPPGHDGDHRSDTRLWKIHMLDRLIGNLQPGFDIQFDVTQRVL